MVTRNFNNKAQMFFRVNKFIFLFNVIPFVLKAASFYEIQNLDIGCADEVVGSLATCVNNYSEITGTVTFGGTNPRNSAFIWTKENGLVEICSNETCPPTGINIGTQIVGSIPQVNSPPQGYYWSLNGGFIQLTSFIPFEINDDGLMVGIHKPANSATSIIYIKNLFKQIYTSLNLRQIIDINELYRTSKVSEVPMGINNKNEVIGILTFQGCKLNALHRVKNAYAYGFLWHPEGKCTEFGEIVPQAINDISQVILVSDFSEKGSSWLWENGAIKLLWDQGLAKAINNASVIVGSKQEHAVIWENGELRKLIDLIENEDWEKLEMAADINDMCEIVGWGIYKGRQSAFILTPK